MIVFSSLQIRRGTRVLLDNATATVNPGQKVGLVGKNGCGKSTLLALLKGEIAADGGSYTFPNNWALAWVNQETPALDVPAIEYVIDGDREFRQLEAELQVANDNNDGHAIATLHGKLDALDAWTIRSRAASLLHGLGFSNEQLQSPVRAFSGGWRMRLNLAQALVCRSDLLLLDEPTNHLDLDAVIWLERWLKSYPGTLVLISHDRDFLDPIVDKILHIENETINEYTGNYSSFERQRVTKLAQQQSLYQSQQEKVAHLQSYIDRFRAQATKAKQAQSRIKMLERMELIAPAHVDNPFTFSFRQPESLPNPLLRMEKVSAGYGDKVILQSIKLNLVPGSRIGLLGRNGAGKSTLIKMLAGTLEPLSGEIGLAKGIKLGYFAQHQLEFLRADESPLQHLSRIAPRVLEQQLRDYLGGFGFQGDKVTEITERFSGGEKARLVLALIVWQRPNLLLLDEPTNHLDLDMRQALTEALIDFEGHWWWFRTTAICCVLLPTICIWCTMARWSSSRAIWTITSSGLAICKSSRHSRMPHRSRTTATAPRRVKTKSAVKPNSVRKPNRCVSRSPSWNNRWISWVPNWPRWKNSWQTRRCTTSAVKPI